MFDDTHDKKAIKEIEKMATELRCSELQSDKKPELKNEDVKCENCAFCLFNYYINKRYCSYFPESQHPAGLAEVNPTARCSKFMTKEKFLNELNEKKPKLTTEELKCENCAFSCFYKDGYMDEKGRCGDYGTCMNKDDFTIRKDTMCKDFMTKEHFLKRANDEQQKD